MSDVAVLPDVLRPGRVITKQSFPRWYELHLKILYWGIKEYQKKKYGKNWRPVHVYVVLPAPERLRLEYAVHGANNHFEAGEVGPGTLVLFEQTWPTAQWTHPHYLWDKTYAINEWREPLQSGPMVEEAVAWIGRKYDLGDLADFAISGFILGAYKRVIRFVGDKARRLGVCSTVAAYVLNRGGCEITDPNAITPAYYEGNGPGWSVVQRFEWGKPVGV
jgi:hypothetical protein